MRAALTIYSVRRRRGKELRRRERRGDDTSMLWLNRPKRIPGTVPILEVGVGGTYDCTNIVPQPIVTAISALGIDHTAVLGKTLPEIAWQKGGIYKVCGLSHC